MIITKKQNNYIPGTCNIGFEESESRKTFGLTWLIVSTAILASIIFLKLPNYYAIALSIPIFFSSIGLLQSQQKFCAYYGLHGRYNFEKLGNALKVQEEKLKKKDKEKAVQLIIISAIASLALTALAFLALNYL